MSAPQLRQATCVAIGGRGVLLEGPPGSGKSTLALELIDRGARLVGDDGVLLTRAEGLVLAAPAPAIAGLIEVRNVGLVPLPACTAPVALWLRLAPDAPRYVERAEAADLLGCRVPRLWFDPVVPAAAIRVELALAHHGLATGPSHRPPHAAG